MESKIEENLMKMNDEKDEDKEAEKLDVSCVGLLANHS